MVDTAEAQQRNFWFEEDGTAGAVELLGLVRLYGEADKSMRAEVRSQMGMGESDLAALRYIIAGHRSSQVLRQRDIAEKLDISNASASALVDRLCEQGHVERVEHPADRRSVAVVPTAKAGDAVRETVGSMHEKLLGVAGSFTTEESEVLKRFFREMIDVMEHA